MGKTPTKKTFNISAAGAKRFGRSLSDYLIGFGNDTIDLKYVNNLIAHGADIETKDEFGNAIAGLAVNFGQVNVLKAAITAGANINAANNYGMTPLMIAAYYGDTDCAQVLLNEGARMTPGQIKKVMALAKDEYKSFEDHMSCVEKSALEKVARVIALQAGYATKTSAKPKKSR